MSRGFQEVKVPRFRDNGTGCGKVVSLTHRPPLPPRKCSWYSLLLEAESTIVGSEGFYVNEKSTDTTCNRTSDLPICSTAPVLPRSPKMKGTKHKMSPPVFDARPLQAIQMYESVISTSCRRTFLLSPAFAEVAHQNHYTSRPLNITALS